MSIEVRQTTRHDWELWRDLRLRALQDSPTAFGSTLDRELTFTGSDWKGRTGGVADATTLGAGTAGPSVLAFADEVPVGMGGGFRDLPSWLHVVAMWTDPAWRGRGVGRAVLGFLTAWAGEAGLRVHLDVTVGNDGARALYEGYGFVATGETRPLRDGSAYLVERMVLPA